MKKYKLAVFIGRFQPYHLGHHSVVQKALEIADTVLVMIGSSYGPRTLRNPFTYQERRNFIWSSNEENKDRIFISPLTDHLYNDEKWIEDIQREVAILDDIKDKEITLIGYSKDHSSYYLKLFPQWDSVNVEQEHILSSTEIRDEYFFSKDLEYYFDDPIVPEAVYNFLQEFDEEAWKTLQDEYRYVLDYKKKWKYSPFPPTFVTVDAVVVQSGHVLLVKRKSFPGKGLWALPGGFLNQEEKIEDGMIRELREETRIKVPAPVLRGNIKAREVFDDPNRSSRGRTITHAFLIHLPPDLELPKVKGSDDAEKAKWVPLAAVRRDQMFEDHYDIIFNLTSRI